MISILNNFPLPKSKAEVKIYNPHETKIDPKIISVYFIGYPKQCNGIDFTSQLISP